MRPCRTAAAVAWGLLAACATGGEGDDGGPVISFGPPSSDGGDATSTGSDDGDGDGDPTVATTKPEDGGDPDPTFADTSGDGDAGSTDGDGSGSDGGEVACVNDLSCPTATPIGGVAGDETSPTLDVSGDQPTWLEFQVSENNSDIIGEQLTFTATLVSPPGVDFDLFVFRGGEGATSGCGGIPGMSTNATPTDSVTMTWGEGGFGNNIDDGAWVAVEVRAKAAMCSPGAQWTLTVVGG